MKRYVSPFGIAVDILYGIICLYILIFQTSNVLGNLEASFIWAYPMAASNLAIHRKINRENNKNDN
jgi:hypothetical protein